MKNINLEKDIIKTKNVYYAFYHARFVIKDRLPEAEPFIMKDTHYAYLYAENIIKGRWLEAEPFILKDPAYAYNYARYVIKEKLDYGQYIICNKNNVNELYVGCFF